MKTKLSSARKTRSSNTRVAGNGRAVSLKARRMLINGQWEHAESGETFSTYNPATGEVICEVAAGGRGRACGASTGAGETAPTVPSSSTAPGTVTTV